MVVNGNGERFVSESISYIVALRKFKEEPTTDFYWVFDDPASYGLMPNGNASRIDYSFLLETGDIVKGENYEDLAEKTGLFGPGGHVGHGERLRRQRRRRPLRQRERCRPCSLTAPCTR